jgi:hypothetical protein
LAGVGLRFQIHQGRFVGVDHRFKFLMGRLVGVYASCSDLTK